MKVGDLVRLNLDYDSQLSIFNGDLRQGLGIIIKIAQPSRRDGWFARDYICYVRFSKMNKIEKCYRSELELIREL